MYDLLFVFLHSATCANALHSHPPLVPMHSILIMYTGFLYQCRAVADLKHCRIPAPLCHTPAPETNGLTRDEKNPSGGERGIDGNPRNLLGQAFPRCFRDPTNKQVRSHRGVTSQPKVEVAVLAQILPLMPLMPSNAPP